MSVRTRERATQDDSAVVPGPATTAGRSPSIADRVSRSHHGMVHR